MPLNPQMMGVRYIITMIEYLTHWAEVLPVKDCTTTMAMNFLFQHVLTRFGCPKILVRNFGTHFLNETINALIEEFQLYHQKSTPYHPQANGTVEAFKKILEIVLTKVCNAQRSPDKTTTLQRNVLITAKVEATNHSKKIMQVMEEACRMVPKLAIPKEEPVEVHIRKFSIAVCDTWTEMARVQLELNLQIIKL
eukprot:PITA_12376